jgi:hypothetical protein
MTIGDIQYTPAAEKGAKKKKLSAQSLEFFSL